MTNTAWLAVATTRRIENHGEIHSGIVILIGKGSEAVQHHSTKVSKEAEKKTSLLDVTDHHPRCRHWWRYL